MSVLAWFLVLIFRTRPGADNEGGPAAEAAQRRYLPKKMPTQF
jgi:hypothetical protein